MIRELTRDELQSVSGYGVYDSVMAWVNGDHDDLQQRFNPASHPIVEDSTVGSTHTVVLSNGEKWVDVDGDGEWDQRILLHNNPNGEDNFYWNERYDTWQDGQSWRDYLRDLWWDFASPATVGSN
jgi:hypothetical protein